MCIRDRIESALVAHPSVVEAGVCPVPDPKTGHAAVAFVVVHQDVLAAAQAAGPAGLDELTEALRLHVGQAIGPVAKPRDVVVVPDVPKTRSGKIMRRLLTQLFEGTALGDTTSLQNEPCVEQIAAVMAQRS